jgi:hypothetical protein
MSAPVISGSGASSATTAATNWKSFWTEVRVEEAGTNGAEVFSAGFTQHGHFAAQDASHFETIGTGCAAMTFPANTSKAVVRTTNHFAASRNDVCACVMPLLFLLRVLELLQILGGFFVEILKAGFAAELNFLTFVHEDIRLAMVAADGFIGNDAGLQWIGFRLCCRLFVGCESCQHQRACHHERHQSLLHAFDLTLLGPVGILNFCQVFASERVRGTDFV